VPATLGRVCRNFALQREAERSETTWNDENAIDAYIAGDTRYHREMHELVLNQTQHDRH
jgi:predicted nicotinamide N-methyase